MFSRIVSADRVKLWLSTRGGTMGASGSTSTASRPDSTSCFLSLISRLDTVDRGGAVGVSPSPMGEGDRRIRDGTDMTMGRESPRWEAELDGGMTTTRGVSGGQLPSGDSLISRPAVSRSSTAYGGGNSSWRLRGLTMTGWAE